MYKQIVKQTTSDRKIKEKIKIYIWIDLFAYMPNNHHICPHLSQRPGPLTFPHLKMR